MLTENIWFFEIISCLLLLLHPILTDGSKGDLHLLLVGNTGNGKSATGNTILGKKVFETSSDVSSLTTDIKLKTNSHSDGRKLTVVDTPGFVDTNLKPTEYLSVYFDFMDQAMSRSPQGYHAFLYVVRYGVRLTDEDKQTFYALINCFGEEYFSRYGVLIVTFGDMYDPEDNDGKSFSDWINTQDGVLNEMMNELEGRVVLFDNKSKGSKRTTQVDRLIKIVDRLSVINSRYSSDHFELAIYQRNKYAVEAKLSEIELEVRKELDRIINKLENFKSDKGRKQINQLYDLRSILDKLLEEIEAEDNDTGVLNDLITAIQNVIENIQNEINYVKNPPRKNEIQKYSSSGMIGDVIGAVKNFLSYFYNYVRQIIFRYDQPRIANVPRDDEYSKDDRESEADRNKKRRKKDL